MKRPRRRTTYIPPQHATEQKQMFWLTLTGAATTGALLAAITLLVLKVFS